ncbi:MAG TPA: LemA family protein [Luteibaculaceae bacterium]|nr:LemA family protein [Luteibaculaceae bacterium]
MKKSLLIFGLILLVAVSVTSCGYNGLATGEEKVNASWAQVETQYQRRADLIPNLVNTVKGYADFEKSTLTEVTNARAGVSNVKVDPSKLTEESLAKYQAAQERLGAATRNLINVVFEKYPDLKANQNFLELQAQLEGTENRITVARNDFNDVVNDYNSRVVKFPTNLTAKIFGFEKKAYFKAEASAADAPEVKF